MSEDLRNSIHCAGKTGESENVSGARVIRDATKAISFRVHEPVIGFLAFTGTSVVEVNTRISTRRVLSGRSEAEA